jgi:hypothetical protein
MSSPAATRVRMSVAEMAMAGSCSRVGRAHARIAFQARVGALRHGQRHARQQLLEAHPGVQSGKLVLPDDQEPLRIGLVGLQLTHRVQRVARTRPLQFAAFEHEARLVGDGQAQHRLAMRRRGQRPCLLPGLANGHPAQLVQLQLGQGLPCQRQVREVRRVETAAEQPDLPYPRDDCGVAPRRGCVRLGAARRRTHHASQSRGGRKSVYSRASADPGSGVQS